MYTDATISSFYQFLLTIRVQSWMNAIRIFVLERISPNFVGDSYWLKYRTMCNSSRWYFPFMCSTKSEEDFHNKGVEKVMQVRWLHQVSFNDKSIQLREDLGDVICSTSTWNPSNDSPDWRVFSPCNEGRKKLGTIQVKYMYTILSHSWLTTNESQSIHAHFQSCLL